MQERTPRPILDVHQRIDRLRVQVEAACSDRLNCKLGCTDCCVDGISVFQVEADRIRDNHASLLREGLPHEEGKCAFLDAVGACRIYEDRPYVCRTQGLPLRWLEDDPSGEVFELRDICPLNESGPPIESLPEASCWTIGPFEAELALLQSGRGHENPRVELRALFERSAITRPRA